MTRREDEALSTVIGAVLVTLGVFVAYVVMNSYGVPAMCESAEVRHFAELKEGIAEMISAQNDVISAGETKTVYLPLGGTYPVIPFFIVPTGFGGSAALYPITVTLTNIAPKDSNVAMPSTLTLTGKALRVMPGYNFLEVGEIRVELGMMAIGSKGFSWAGGDIIQGNYLYIPFFDGQIVDTGDVGAYYTLLPESGGNGDGVVVCPASGSNFTLKISGTKLPEHFWQMWGDSHGISLDVSGDEVTIYLSGCYKLVTGIAAIDTSTNVKPGYLYPYSPRVQTSPSSVAVEVRDRYNNPVRNYEVQFFTINEPATICYLNDSNSLNCVDAPQPDNPVKVYTDDRGIASVLVTKSCTLVNLPDTPAYYDCKYSTVVARIERSGEGPYELAFLVNGNGP